MTATVQCKASATDTSDCLSAREVEAARRLYDGPHDPATGERLTIAGPQPGSELAWAGVFVPDSVDQPINSEKMALDVLRNLAFEHNPGAGYSLADVKFDRSTLDQLRALHPVGEGIFELWYANADGGVLEPGKHLRVQASSEPGCGPAMVRRSPVAGSCGPS